MRLGSHPLNFSQLTVEKPSLACINDFGASHSEVHLFGSLHSLESVAYERIHQIQQHDCFPQDIYNEGRRNYETSNAINLVNLEPRVMLISEGDEPKGVSAPPS